MKYTDFINTPAAEYVAVTIMDFKDTCHGLAKEAGWWTNLETGEDIKIDNGVFCEKTLLIVTELAEATEGFRKNLIDDKIPTRSMVECEFADAMIRLADLAGAMNLDLAGAIVDKLRFNTKRDDHKIENRLKEGGKKF
jgi:NTP pyrophosphatase (non-canonical NTP hydrolase)